jgi:uncharacterized protein YprB with RNaseH-like and TPR domain
MPSLRLLRGHGRDFRRSYGRRRMSELAERLVRLRQQAGLPARASAPIEADASRLTSLPLQARDGGVPESIRRLLGIRARGSVAPALPRVVDGELPGDEIAPGLRYRERHFDWLPAPAMLDASFAKDFAMVGRRDVLAFDTETTGLAGGTGTRAFMIGVADWVEGDSHQGIAAVAAPTSGEGVAAVAAPTSGEGVAAFAAPTLRVRQLFLTQMRGEDAMLEAFAAWLAPSTVLVSYNGRCYDAPLLATRYRLARMGNPLAGLAHADLLFPVRRRFRGTWENCRLATVERRWLGVLREDDRPGSEAPRAWLDYLRGGSARDLRRVLAHNDRDLVSLGELCLKLAEAELADAVATA